MENFLTKANRYKMEWNGLKGIINIKLTAKKCNAWAMPLNYLGIHILFSLSEVYFETSKSVKQWLGHYITQ